MNASESILSVSQFATKLLLTILSLFLMGCMLGYLTELLFRRFVSAKKWVNPGFMKGPWLPLYGFGLTLMFFLCWLVMSIFPSDMTFYNPLGDMYGRTTVNGPIINDLIPLCLIGVSLVLLEFIAGMIFVKGFKVRLWDYTNMKGNVQGVICPVFNVIWFAVGVIYYYGLSPFVYELFNWMYAFLFGSGNEAAHFGTLFIIGLIYGIFVVDLVHSIGLFSKVVAFARKSGMVERYEKLREETRKLSDETKERFFDSLPDVVKKSIEESKAKEKLSDKAFERVRELILIDPDKKGTEGNYDENGRPKKEE